jgi:serine/threonine protein kinase
MSKGPNRTSTGEDQEGTTAPPPAVPPSATRTKDRVPGAEPIGDEAGASEKKHESALRHVAPAKPPPPARSSGSLGAPADPPSGSIPLAETDLEHLPDSSLPPLALPTSFSIRRGVVLGGRFRVNQLIGAGAQSYVYSAEHTSLKSPVAIKCLKPELVTPELVERFAREAQALTAIRNAHVAHVIDVGRAPCGTPFMVMEYLAGGDLAALLETQPRLEPRQATEILLQTCEGLAAAHALDLIHQDIKPSNIFLSNEMGIVKAKIVDFGVARVAAAPRTTTPPRFTRSHIDEATSGTPIYMSPEQLTGNAVIDERVDIFALGMVLYEMLRGTNAFDLEMSTRPDNAPVRIERAGIEPEIANVIERCLAQDPDDRYDSVAELAVALMPFAPARARVHVETAIALLTQAGRTIGSSVPSSIPPGRASQPEIDFIVPPPPLLPGQRRPSTKPSTTSSTTKDIASVPPPAQPKWRIPVIVGAIVVVAVMVGMLVGRQSSSPPTAATPDVGVSTAATSTSTETAPVSPPEPKAATPTSSATQTAITPRAPSPPPTAITPPKPTTSTTAAPSTVRTSKPPAHPNGGSEDLGF